MATCAQAMATVPPAFAARWPALRMSASQYGTKLAVATAGCGSKYPKHVDNSGLPDQRKLTIIYYLNPGYQPAHGGALRARSHCRFVPPLIHFYTRFTNIFGASIVEATMRPNPRRAAALAAAAAGDGAAWRGRGGRGRPRGRLRIEPSWSILAMLV